MTNKEFFISQWRNEVPGTLNAIKALPQDINVLNYKPNAKARSAMQLMQHMLAHPECLSRSFSTGTMIEIDAHFSSLEDMAAYFNEQSAILVEKVSAIDELQWMTREVSFMHNGHTVFILPMYKMFWKFLYDIIHHRGQLTTYYRSMGVRNPAIYGPAAEDIEEMMAAAK